MNRIKIAVLLCLSILLLSYIPSYAAYSNSLSRQLLNAAAYGEPARVAALLKAGANINAIDSDGNTPLMLATWSSSVDIIELLLSRGANANLKNRDGDTALMISIKKCSRAIVLANLKYPVNFDQVDNKGNTALLIAAGAPIDCVEELLVKGANPNSRNRSGQTPIMRAIERGKKEAATALIKAGADLAARDADGKTVLMYAAGVDDADLLKLIVDSMLATTSLDQFINEVDSSGKTALMHAAIADRPYAVKYLLTFDPDIKIRSKEGKAAIDYGREFARYELIVQLTANGAKSDIDLPRLKKEYGDLCLIEATKEGGYDIIDLLLATGIDPNIKDNFGKTALMYAADEEFILIMKRLMAAGADANAQMASGRTALMCAVSRGNAVAIKLLLAAGADVNARTEMGWTALMEAALYAPEAYANVVEILLANGADPTVKNNEGKTALDYAERFGRDDELIRLMEKYKAIKPSR